MHESAIRQFTNARALYKKAGPSILKSKNEWAIDPYSWDEVGISMTPIESALWSDIRQIDAVLYPQYPVGRFFVDFANPAAKVAIECDGKYFHLDKQKDFKRDCELEQMGWVTYRITGSDCKKDFDSETMTPSAAAKFLQVICNRHKLIRTH